MTTPSTPYTNALTLPATYIWTINLIDCLVTTTDPLQYSFAQSVSALAVSPGVSLSFTASAGTTVYTLHYLLIVFDNSPTLPLLNFYTYSYSSVTSNIFLSTNFNVNPLYGTALNPNCIIGFFILNSINVVATELDFDLITTGFTNGVDNSVGNALKIFTFCVKDMICPVMFPYRIASDKVNCYDCPTGSLEVLTCNHLFILALTPNLVHTVGFCV